jgi:hypothetical protein
MKVLKWQVPLNDLPHAIGVGQVVLVAQQPHGRVDEVQVWTLETGADATREVRVFGTGHTIPDGWEPIGSCLSVDGQFVWHVFELAAGTKGNTFTGAADV